MWNECWKNFPDYRYSPQGLLRHEFFTTCITLFDLYKTEIDLIILKLEIMLRWTVIFLVVAIIAAIFGFGGIAAGAASIAKILFFVFLVLFIVSLFVGRSRV